jgi:hypothetical protein
MEAITVLIVLPVALGAAAEIVLRDPSRASLAAAIASALAIYASLHHLDPDGSWNGLATFLVSPLAIAFSLASVLTCHGYLEGRRRHRRPVV